MRKPATVSCDTAQGCSAAELFLVGGFCDEGGESKQVMSKLLTSLQSSQIVLHLALACIGSANTSQGSPRCTSLILNTATGTAHTGESG